MCMYMNPISYHTQICHPKPPLHKISPTAGRPAHNSPAQIIAAISGIAPPMQTGLSVQDHIFASTNNPDILDQLRCPLCLTIVHQPLELPCRALVCTNCIVHWFMASNCSEVKCPCCILDTPLAPSQLKPAPPLIQILLVGASKPVGRRYELVSTALTSVQKNLDLQMLMCRQRVMCSEHWLPPALKRSQFLLEELLSTTSMYTLCLIHHIFSLATHIYAYHPCSYPYWDSKCKNHEVFCTYLQGATLPCPGRTANTTARGWISEHSWSR